MNLILISFVYFRFRQFSAPAKYKPTHRTKSVRLHRSQYLEEVIFITKTKPGINKKILSNLKNIFVDAVLVENKLKNFKNNLSSGIIFPSLQFERDGPERMKSSHLSICLLLIL